MRRLFTLLVICAVMIVISGCASIGETSKERQVRIERQKETEMKMLVDDWDSFWMNDHTSKLSKKNI